MSDVETYLAEWDQPSETTQIQGADPQIPELAEQFQELGEYVIREQDRRSMEEVLESTYSGFEDYLTRGEVARYLETAYLNDPELQEAWDRRFEDPGKFDRALRQVRDNLSKEIEARPLTQSRFANIRRSVASAVASARVVSGGFASNLPDLSSMSDREFAEYKAKLFMGR